MKSLSETQLIRLLILTDAETLAKIDSGNEIVQNLNQIGVILQEKAKMISQLKAACAGPDKKRRQN